MSSNDELERMRRELAEKRVQLAGRFGELRGRAVERFEALRTDPEMREALRAVAWIRHRPKGAPRRIVDYDFETGQITTALPGWPKGVDPDRFVSEYLQERRDGFLEQFNFGSEGVLKIEEPAETPSVVRLRDIVRGGGPGE